MPAKYSDPQRLALFESIRRWRATGLSMRAACLRCRVNPTLYGLWEEQFATYGHLNDRRTTHSGRKPLHILTPEEKTALQFWMGLKEGRFATAIEFFRDDKACLPATRDFINNLLAEGAKKGKMPDWPDCLRRAAQLPAGFEAQYKGPKAMQHAAPVGRYAHTIKIDGVEFPLTPGRVLVFDDYSTNQPYQLRYADGKVRLCRQVLVGMDAGTRAYRGFFHVGKEKDQYTGADALEVIYRTMQGMGHRPDVLILEKGKWHSNALRGIPLSEDGKRRWGNLEECGVIVEYQYDSRGKFELEGAFNLLQAWLAGEGSDIGRFRGIMEREALDMVAINAGKLARGGRDADDCGFLTFEQSVNQHERAAIDLNARLKMFKALGRVVSPDQLDAEQPYQKRPLEPEHRWLFYPVKSEAIIKENGNVCKIVEGREYAFRVNGISPHVHLPNGYRVLIAFDPERPDLGCRVANRETGAANFGSHRLGECLLTAAPLLQAAPRVEIWTDGQEAEEEDAKAGYQTRKGAIKSARTAFRAILPGGKRGLRLDTIRNRQGDRMEMVSGTPESGLEPGVSEAGGAEPGMPEHDRARTPGGMDGEAAKQRSKRRAGVDTAPPRQTRLKTPSNASLEMTPEEEADLEAMESAFLATLL
jgi:hypothetical protein